MHVYLEHTLLILFVDFYNGVSGQWVLIPAEYLISTNVEVDEGTYLPDIYSESGKLDGSKLPEHGIVLLTEP